MKQKGTVLLLSAVICACLAGCVSYRPEISGTPAPSATPAPTPTPAVFTATVTAEPLPTDVLGLIIEDPDTHYYSYLSFGNLRVYEYDTGTFLDGICYSSYPVPLAGTIRIIYRTEDGRICGEGTLHNAKGTNEIQPGSNAIYAEILTDISVLSMDYTFEVTESFRPLEQ